MKLDTTKPIYFFCPRAGRILKGEFVRTSELGNVIVGVQVDASGRQFEHYFSSGDQDHYNFTNSHREAKKDGRAWYKRAISDKKAELGDLYKDFFHFKWGLK